jgi:hypothetical protein
MLLAERGLPSSNTAGYELFDQVGSLGLTSFMQEVTRVGRSRAKSPAPFSPSTEYRRHGFTSSWLTAAISGVANSSHRHP